MTTPFARPVVAALIAERLLDPADEQRALAVVERSVVSAEQRPDAAAGMPRIVEVVAYLGGALVLAAGWLFVMQQWNDLGEGARTAALVVVAVALGIAGFATVRSGPVGESAARRRLGGTLLAGAAVAAGFAAAQVLLMAGDYPYGDVQWPAIIGGVVACGVAALVHPLARTAVGLVVMLGGAVTAAAALMQDRSSDEGLWLGIALFLVAALWLVVTEAGAFAQPSVARGLGSALALFGAQFAVLAGEDAWPGYLLTLLVVVVGVLLYLARLDWPYLAAAVLGVTFLVPEVVSDWTDDSLGTVGGVLVAGITLLGASLAGYRLRAESEV